jgi:hypothetical protein
VLCFMLICSLLLPAAPNSVMAEAEPVNLALGKTVTASQHCSGCGTPRQNIVDGNADTYWQTNDADVTDSQIWIQVDLGESKTFNRVVLKGLETSKTESFKISYGNLSSPEISMTPVTQFTSDVTIDLPAEATARYVRLDIQTISGLTTKFRSLAELEIYHIVSSGEPSEPPVDPEPADPEPADPEPVDPQDPVGPQEPQLPEPGQDPAQHVNLAPNYTVKSSSNCGSCNPSIHRDNVKDGDTSTYWAPTGWDFTGVNPDGQPDEAAHLYIEADLGADQWLSRINMQNMNTQYITSYKITFTKNGETTPSHTVTKNKSDFNGSNETVILSPVVKSRTVKVEYFIDPARTSRFNVLAELQIFGQVAGGTNPPEEPPPAEEPEQPSNPPAPTVIQSVYFLSGDQGVRLDHDQWLKLGAEGQLQLHPVVVMTDHTSRTPSGDEVTYSSSDESVVNVNAAGLISVSGEGVAYVDAKLALNGGTEQASARIWIDTYSSAKDPSTINLVYKKPVTSSTFCKAGSCNGSIGTYDYYINDGDLSRYWRALSSDFRDNNKQAWVAVDLGKPMAFNKIVMNISIADVSHYELLVSNDGSSWTEVYATKFLTTREEVALLQEQNARYIKFNAHMIAASKPILYEMEVYHTDDPPAPPLPNGIKDFFLASESKTKYDYKEDIVLAPAQGLKLQAGIVMYEPADAEALEDIVVTYESARPEVATIDQEGNIQALTRGASILTVTAKYRTQTKIDRVIAVVEDPSAYYATTTLKHDRLITKIGDPAVLETGELTAPIVHITPHVNLTAELELFKAEESVYSIPAMQLTTGQAVELPLELDMSEGFYMVRMKFTDEQQEVWYDQLYFTIQNSAKIAASGQSIIAYIGDNGKLNYVPDYKGNQIIDFSNSGYQGGGVKLPDVKAAIVVNPGEGDDTARIQEAIDYVSKLPLNAEGFRGAVVLSRGTFQLDSALYISKSGIVIRGQGDSDEGTILHSTGTEKRNILEVGDNVTTPVILENTRENITDLYVPSGGRTFHVADASGFRVGDSVMVSRYSNSSWIHEINMDVILEYDAGIVQWEPFELMMDRVITQIDGNRITIDAPVVNAIELKWGGGSIVKYDDSNRLDNIGVENLKVTVEFDASEKDGNEYIDEDHAAGFVNLNNVKNAWVRNIHAKHLTNFLVFTGRNTKWITIQDSRMDEHVSIVTGSRRYSFYYSGQLALGQRLSTDGARHAFTYNSRVVGPNVFLDAISTNNHNRSEPHQRYSVGGLYDNVIGRLNVMDRGRYGTGHGWAGANFVLWNVEDELTVQRPPTATNYSIGFVGTVLPGDFKNIEVGSRKGQPREDGYFEHNGQHVQPVSLYKQQLADRLGAEALENILETSVGGEELDTPKPAPIDEPAEDGPSSVPNTPAGDLLKIEVNSQGNKTATAKVSKDQARQALTNGKINLIASAADIDQVVLELPAASLTDLAEQPVILTIEGGISEYRLPLHAIDWQRISASMGVSTEDIQLILEISKATENEDFKWNRADVKPVTSFISYHLYAKSGDQTWPINQFGKHYVDRVIPIEAASFSPGKATGATIDPVTGALSFVPTVFEQRDGKWFAVLKRNSNSIYVVMEYERSFDDLDGHWARAEVERMASKLLVNGVTDKSFAPDGHITRAQLIAMLVRGLGLSPASAKQADFKDVQSAAWYYADAATAVEAGLITGYEDHSLRPDQVVTRNEMVTILHRAMHYAGGQTVSGTDALAAYEDSRTIPAWAAESAAELIQAGIVEGKQPGIFSGQDTATRAEAAVIISRVMKHLGFIYSE